MTFQTKRNARNDTRCHTSATPAQQWPRPSSRTGLQPVPRDDLPEVVPVFPPAHTALKGEHDVRSFFTDDRPQTTSCGNSTPTSKWRSFFWKFTGGRTLFGSLTSSLTPRSEINSIGNNANHLSTSGSAMIPPSVYMYDSTLSPCTQGDPLTSTAPTAVQLSSGNPPTNVGVFVPAESEPGTNPSPVHELDARPVFELASSYGSPTAEPPDLHTGPNARTVETRGSEPGGPSDSSASPSAVSTNRSSPAVKSDGTLETHDTTPASLYNPPPPSVTSTGCRISENEMPTRAGTEPSADMSKTSKGSADGGTSPCSAQSDERPSSGTSSSRPSSSRSMRPEPSES